MACKRSYYRYVRERAIARRLGKLKKIFPINAFSAQHRNNLWDWRGIYTGGEYGRLAKNKVCLSDPYGNGIDLWDDKNPNDVRNINAAESSLPEITLSLAQITRPRLHHRIRPTTEKEEKSYV
jgi:hypothetical protein